MADATEVRVAGAGSVYVAPEGETLPTDLTALAGNWVELGYVNTDGVTFTHARETEDLDAWQGSKIRVLTTSEPVSVAFSVMQTSDVTLPVIFGGGSIATVAGPPDIHTFTPPAEGTNTIRAMVIEFTDGTLTYRYVMGRVQIEGEVSYTLSRDGAVEYPLEFGVLDDSPNPKFKIVSDDPAMATA